MITFAGTFCPACGDRLNHRYVEEEERERLVCVACGHIHYLNPKIVAGTIPVDSDRVWLLRRAIEPRVGAWTFPAGFMELGETVEDAARRETREELGMAVHLGKLLGVYSWPEVSTVHIIYVAEVVSPPTGGREALEYAAFRVEEIPWPELAFRSTQRALHDWVTTLTQS